MAYGTLGREAGSLLRKWLKESTLTEGSRLPSERDLAKELGVGHYALNRAMAALISEGLVKREGYKLYYSGDKDKKKASPFSCDLVVAQGSIHRTSYAKVAKELDILLTIHPWGSLEEAVSILDKLDSPETESVIFDPPHGQSSSGWEPSILRLTQHNVPIVCLGQPVAEAFSVMADYPKGLKVLIRYLLDLGHHELAFATISPRAPLSMEVLNEWQNLCREYGISASSERLFFQHNSRIMPEDSQALAIKFAKEWSKVTALVLFTDHEYSIQHLMDELASQGKEVPQKLTLVFLGDSKPLRTSNPPVTSVTFDMALVQETAFDLVRRAFRKKALMGLLPPPYNIRIQPKLAIRGSSSANPIKTGKTKPAALLVSPEKNPATTWLQLFEKKQDLESCLRKPYPQASQSGEDRFLPIDLSGYVNRPLNFRRGWLGDQPLKYFSPGRHMIHGVPFHVLGGTTRSDCGAIVFHSVINVTGNAHKLPNKLSIPLGLKASAIYILHGCGYAKYLQTFGTYSFHHKKKLLDSVPLVPLGQPPPDLNSSELESACQKANIQDWWPDYPHLDFPGARMAPMLENDEPDHIHRHVFLYTMEWINPQPQLEITHMEISVDPSQSTTLGLLSICALLPKEKK